MSIDVGLIPRSCLVILDLEDVYKSHCAILKSKILEGRCNIIYFAIEGLFNPWYDGTDVDGGLGVCNYA